MRDFTVLTLNLLSPSHADDRDLLARFTGARDEAAFAALLDRHSRLVWAVCRSL